MKTPRTVLAAAAALLIVVAATVGALLAARGHGQSQTAPTAAAYRGFQPQGDIPMSAFALHSYRGPIVRARDLRGEVVLVTFLDTHCTQSCPIVAGIVGKALALLTPGERNQVDALAISVEPRRDTPTSIRHFLRAHHVLGRLDFLIGSVRRLRPVWKHFHVVSAVSTGNADIHSSDVRVFDRRGVWVSIMQIGTGLNPANLAHDLRLALKEAS